VLRYYKNLTKIAVTGCDEVSTEMMCMKLSPRRNSYERGGEKGGENIAF